MMFQGIAERLEKHLNSNVYLRMRFKPIVDYDIGEIVFEETLDGLIDAVADEFTTADGIYLFLSSSDDEDEKMKPCGVLEEKVINDGSRRVRQCITHVQIYDSKNNKA